MGNVYDVMLRENMLYKHIYIVVCMHICKRLQKNQENVNYGISG